MKKYISFITLLACSIAHAYRDTETGTFLTRDPIGYQDGPNLYCYVHCNPITQFDAFGLMTESQAEEDAQTYYNENYEGDQSFENWYEEKQDWWYEQLSSDGYTIYKNDFSEVVMASSAAETRKSAFVALGQGGEDPDLFRKGSEKEIADLKAQGYDVNIYDYNKNGTPAAQVVQNGFQNIVNLDSVSIYAHGGNDINLGGGGGLWSEQSKITNPQIQIPISQLKLGNPTDSIKISLYSCNLTPGSTYAREMANALDTTVMGAQAGYGMRFDNGVPRSQVGPLKVWPLWVPLQPYHPINRNPTPDVLPNAMPH